MRVAIVGAGFAGLTAARMLVENGVSVEILEADAHVGGRARSAHATVELGPEWVHGRPPSTCAIIRDAGLAVDESADVHYRWRDGTLRRDADLWLRFGKLLEPAAAASRDESARAYMNRLDMRPDDAELFAMLVEGFYAAPLDDVSIESVAADASGAGVEDIKQYRVRGGYHRMIEWLVGKLARVPIQRGHAVHAIDWRTDRVQIDHARGSDVFDRAIVTVSAGVLQAGSIRFTPALGAHAESALSRLAMGQVVKVVTCFRAPIWREYAPHDLAFVHAHTTRFPTFWVRSEGDAHQLTAWAGGPHARALASYPADQLADAALDEFTGILRAPRAAFEAARRESHFHDYRHDPFARGAYSYTRPNGLGAADLLARPLGNRLWIAGEATDEHYEGSVAGAIASGQRAAQQVLRSR